jgi:type 1 fimbria pilin
MKQLASFMLLASLLGIQAQAQADDSCDWVRGSQPIHLIRTLPGIQYVPGSASPGDTIGATSPLAYTQSTPVSGFECSNDGDVLWHFNMIAREIFPDSLPPVGGDASDGYVLKTNIDGIGARIQLDAPFDGSREGYFMPENGPGKPFVPVRTSARPQYDLTKFSFAGLRNRVTLVKTGDIEPGMHQIDTELFTGHFSGANLGLVMRYRLQATVVQTQCSLIGDPISTNPVELGDWDKAEFVAKGTTTATVPFSITLSNCQTDPGGQARVTIELDGAEGSLPVPGLDGVFSLTNDSDVEGIGIQILKEDSTPLPLRQEVDLMPIQTGDTVLKFGARFYQTEDANKVRPGRARGALSFIIRYR